VKILIMGLPGSGKTTLGKKLSKEYDIPLWDANVIRETYNDWDFSIQGRERQSLRMRRLAEMDPISISAFVAPLPGYVRAFFPDKLIWMDTVKECKYDDTNKLFKPPQRYDIKITKFGDDVEAFGLIRGCFDRI
jgi:adenylylsulfate kinase